MKFKSPRRRKLRLYQIMFGILILTCLLGLILILRPTMQTEVVRETNHPAPAPSSNLPASWIQPVTEATAVVEPTPSTSPSSRQHPEWALFVPADKIPYLKQISIAAVESERLDVLTASLLTALAPYLQLNSTPGPQTLRAVYYLQDQLVLDLDASCRDWFALPELKAIQVLYSLVNTLSLNLKRDQIRILIGGKEQVTMDALDLQSVFRFNQRLIETSNN